MRKLGVILRLLALVSLVGTTGVQAGSEQEKATAPSKTDIPRKASQQIQDTKRFAENTGLFRASTVIGSNVKDASGKDAGKVEDLMLDFRGDIVYAVLSFGGFLGIGDKPYAVPWNAVMIDRDKRTVFVDVKKETLERAPGFPKDKWPDANDREWGTGIRRSWSDASITAAVKSKLASEQASTLLKVNVDTTNGVVALNGTVDSDRTKQRATALTRQVQGVRNVINNLRVESTRVN